MADKKDSQLTRVESLDGTEVMAITLDPDGTPATRGIVVSNAGLPVDGELLDIAALSPSNNDVLQRKSGVWTNQTPAQLKTDLALVKGDVGLGNVDNTSDATKNAAAVTLTNKTLTSPVINTPTGIVKSDVGLGNVTNDAQLKIVSNLSDLNNAGTARTNLGVAIGSDVQAHSDNLDDIAALADPNADRLLFWDDSAGEFAFLTLGTNLSITGTTLNAAGGGGSPGGSDTQVQFNDGGSFGGDAGLVFNKTTNVLTVSKDSGNPGYPTLAWPEANGLTGFQHDEDLDNPIFAWVFNAQRVAIRPTGVGLRSDGALAFSDSTGLVAATYDAALTRAAAGLIGVTNASSGGAGLEFTEVSDFANAGANKARLYARDNGSGKTQLVVVFPSGAVQVIATEP